MRIISLVPSWTETLIEAGIIPVGRTRFCVHPYEVVKSIPIVGGTKNVNWELIRDLNPDIVLMDKEENTFDMAQMCPYPLLSTHVTSVQTLVHELQQLSIQLSNQRFYQWAEKLKNLIEKGRRHWDCSRVPGSLYNLRNQKSTSDVAYVIWKKPWMIAQRDTFIADVLFYLGANVISVDSKRYAEIELTSIHNGFLLFSTEPYPFLDQIEELEHLGIAGAVVNGESYSWFGIRAIRFLEAHLVLK